MIKHLKGMSEDEFVNSLCKEVYNVLDETEEEKKQEILDKIRYAIKQKDKTVIALVTNFLGLVHLNKQWFLEHEDNDKTSEAQN